MQSLYHAYQAYESKVAMGVFDTRKAKAPRTTPSLQDRLIVGLGDTLIRAGYNLKRHYATHTTNGSLALGRLNR